MNVFSRGFCFKTIVDSKFSTNLKSLNEKYGGSLIDPTGHDEDDTSSNIE